jgi:hypothetical protein
MSRFAVLFAAAALLIAAVPAVSQAAGPTANAARSCGVGDYMSYGTTYVHYIRASNVTCRRARRVVRAFHRCRQGAKGRCGGVDGFSCSENRFNKSRFQYDSIATCRRGGKVVKHKYTQNT